MDQSLRCAGMRDILPDEMRRFRRVEEAFRAACLGWGYDEVRTPALEHLHLFPTAGALPPPLPPPGASASSRAAGIVESGRMTTRSPLQPSQSRKE